MNQAKHRIVRSLVTIIVAMGMVLAAGSAFAIDQQQAQGLVDTARVTFRDMIKADHSKALEDHLEEAMGVLIVPNMFKAGFVLGGAGGTGVLLVKDQETGQWSYPAFYTLSSAIFGAQIGAESAQMVTVIKTQQALDNFLASSFAVNGDASATAGPFGRGAKVNLTTSLITFTQSKGAYVGVSLEGFSIRTRNDYNQAYYAGKDTRAADIVVKSSVRNRGADKLRNTVDNLSRIRAER